MQFEESLLFQLVWQYLSYNKNSYEGNEVAGFFVFSQ